MVPMYIAMYRGTKELILTERYNSLKQEVAYLDEQISKMLKGSNLLGSNTYVKKVAAIQGEPVDSDSMDMLHAKDFFVSCFQLNGEEFDEYLIFRYNPVIISGTTLLSSPGKQDYGQYNQNGMDFAQFQQMVFENERSIQFIAGTEGEWDGQIIGVSKMLGRSHFFYDAALIFTLSQENVSKLFGLKEEKQADFAYVMDRYGEIVYQVNYGAEPLEAEVYENKAVRLNGENYTVFQVMAPNSGLYLALGIADATISQGISDVNRVITIYIGIAVLGMLLFCIFWAWSRAQNMGVVLEELETLKSSISSNILEKLLLNGVYSEKEKQEIGNYLDWDMEFYCVACISTRFHGEEEILEVFCRTDEFIRRFFRCMGLSTGRNERNYIIQIQEEGAPDVGSVAAKLKEFLREQPDVYIGISSVGTGLENVQLCYRQARLMNRQAADEYGSQMKEYQKPVGIREKIFKLNLGNRIYDLISAEEKESLYMLFQRIRSYAARTSWYTEAEIMQFFFEVQNPIARIWDEIEQHGKEKSVLSYRNDRSIVELIDSLEETSCYLCDCIGRNKNDNKNVFCQKMIQFVEDNYTNNDMCVTYAAQHFELSDKYFAALFKEQTGKNFGAYVEAKRMKRAEQYLLETDISMTKVAELVGYNTVDAFYKSFKKIYGLAPGKWKESNKRSEQTENL